MPVQGNRYYNDPGLGAAFSNLAAAFAPPSGSDLAGYATAGAVRQKATGLAELLTYAKQREGFDQTVFDRMGQALGQWNASNGYYGVDQGNATTQRGQDITARTALTTNAADNARAFAQTRYGAIGANQMLPGLPDSVAKLYGLPTSDPVQGNAVLQQGDTLTTPDGRTIAGAPKPPTEEQIKGAILQGLPQTDQRNAVLSGVNVEQVVGPDNKPVYVNRPEAAGQPAYNSGPSTVINNGPNGVPFGEPEKGLVWVRNPDGTIKLNENGAPKAIPYEGGSVYKQQQDDAKAANAKDNSASTKRDIVVQDLDRVLTSIGQNPALTTGVGAQLSGGIGGMPARDVQSLLNTVRANVGFEQLQQMRDSSPTGGALGQVTEKEQELLQSVLGSLDTSQSAEQLTANLKRLKNVYLDIIHGTGKGPAREDLEFGGSKSPPGDAEIYAVNPQNGERLILRNGAWEPVK